MVTVVDCKKNLPEDLLDLNLGKSWQRIIGETGKEVCALTVLHDYVHEIRALVCLMVLANVRMVQTAQ